MATPLVRWLIGLHPLWHDGLYACTYIALWICGLAPPTGMRICCLLLSVDLRPLV